MAEGVINIYKQVTPSRPLVSGTTPRSSRQAKQEEKCD